jgi:hypothetical protein
LPEPIDAVHNGPRLLPITETDVVSTDCACVAENGEEEGDQHAYDFPQGQPEFHFAVYDDAEHGYALVEGPGDQDPAI